MLKKPHRVVVRRTLIYETVLSFEAKSDAAAREMALEHDRKGDRDDGRLISVTRKTFTELDPSPRGRKRPKEPRSAIRAG